MSPLSMKSLSKMSPLLPSNKTPKKSMFYKNIPTFYEVYQAHSLGKT